MSIVGIFVVVKNVEICLRLSDISFLFKIVIDTLEQLGFSNVNITLFLYAVSTAN